MDWIETFMQWTDGIPSPEVFRKWSAITCLSGALERRVWVKTGRGVVYPNLYTMLVAPPAAGKSQSISRVSELWHAVKPLVCAPDNVTKAALIDALGGAHRAKTLGIMDYGKVTFDNEDSKRLAYHVMLVPCSEFGVLLPRHDLEFLSVLNAIYDNPPEYKELRRAMEGRQAHINEPALVMLMGTQPDFLGSLLPEEAWGMGFMSRVIMVYATEAPKISLWAETDNADELRTLLITKLERLVGLYGSMKWTPQAQTAMDYWYQDDLPPKPQHSRLHHYCGRRPLHTLKLCMIASASRGDDMIITEKDFERARGWLLEAEKLMADVFRAMFAKSDSQILQELHFHLWRAWAAEIPAKRIPVAEHIVYEFLQHRVPSEKIPRIVEVAEKSGLIQHNAGGGWIPRPLETAGVDL